MYVQKKNSPRPDRPEVVIITSPHVEKIAYLDREVAIAALPRAGKSELEHSLASWLICTVFCSLVPRPSIAGGRVRVRYEAKYFEATKR